MSTSGRPILAAPPNPYDATNSGDRAWDDDSSNANRRHSSSPKPKRSLVESACMACRKRKSKCDGQRPVCARCQNQNTDCHYEVEQGESRWSALRRTNELLRTERDGLRELITLMQTRPDAEAIEILRYIRVNNHEELSEVLGRFRGDEAHAESRNPFGWIDGEPRLPPLRTVVDMASYRSPQVMGQYSGPYVNADGSRESSVPPVSSPATSQPPNA